MKHVLAIDQGTTGSTCLVIGEDGVIKGRGYREITQHYPEPGWVEHDATEILQRTVDAGRDAIAQAGVVPDCIGITNQRETVLLWDRVTGQPLGRAIVWQDRRTTERCRQLAPHQDEITLRTGLVIDPYFSASKLEWLLERRVSPAGLDVSGVLAGTIDTWLIWKLTHGGVHATDPTNASRTMLYDIGALDWSDRLCTLFSVPRACLPEVRPSAGNFGTAHSEFFGTELPIRGVAGDQQAALFGQGCWNPGTSKNTYGTGAFMLMHAGATRPRAGGGLLTTLACNADGSPGYALEASIFIAGAAVQWLRDGMGIVADAASTEPIAAALPGNDGVYFVPALTGLGAPVWEPEARGTIVGLTRGTTRDHLIRAALEAMAYGTADVLGAMREHSGVALGLLRVDGGAAANNWLMQFQADVLDVPVERPDIVETTALGAAGLAGMAAGVWPDANAFLGVRRYQRFAPTAQAAANRAGLAGWHRAVRAAVAWARDGAS